MPGYRGHMRETTVFSWESLNSHTLWVMEVTIATSVDGPQLLSPTGDPSRPVWLHIKSQSYSTISENLWTLELIPGEIIKVTLTWIAYGIVYVINYFMAPGWQSFQKVNDYTWEVWPLWVAQREMHWEIMSKIELSQPRRLGKVPWCQGISHTFC